MQVIFSLRFSLSFLTAATSLLYHTFWSLSSLFSKFFESFFRSFSSLLFAKASFAVFGSLPLFSARSRSSEVSIHFLFHSTVLLSMCVYRHVSRFFVLSRPTTLLLYHTFWGLSTPLRLEGYQCFMLLFVQFATSHISQLSQQCRKWNHQKHYQQCCKPHQRWQVSFLEKHLKKRLHPALGRFFFPHSWIHR